MKTAHFLLHQTPILLCILIQILSCSPIGAHRVNPHSLYITKSCKTTLYPKLCNKTLSKHAEKVKGSPKLLAMTALVATFNATRTVSKVLRDFRRGPDMKPGERAVVAECVEVVGDAVYELQRSMKRFNQSRKGAQFFLQMDDVETWVSAALTDDDTCMDDFTAVGRRSKVLVRGFVLTIARLTSIALTFINNYASLSS